MKKLVVYFSATGVTKNVASEIAQNIGADLFEIVPKQQYTSADLNWHDANSRSSVEMKDRSSRPAVEDKVNDINQYDTIVLGFPVWWYTAPTIVNTFIEENDLSGKKINVFVTSGSSGAEGAFIDLKETYPKLDFVAAKRLKPLDSTEELVNWIK